MRCLGCWFISPVLALSVLVCNIGMETLHSEIHELDLEQRIASPVERVNCGTYSQKGR
jgi:hypothetical protein